MGKLVCTLATSKKQNSPGNQMHLCWKGLGKLLTDRPAWQNWNVCHQAFHPPAPNLACKHCPYDLCIFWCCHQLIPSNQNVHLPCHAACAFPLCSPAVCLFYNTVTGVTVSYSACSTEFLKSRKPCFSTRVL